MLSKELLEKGYNLLDITEKGDTTKSITYQQEEILLLYLDGMTYREISEEVGRSVECVRQHLVKINYKVECIL
jgi:DNA-binding NarL/FixJ family response regulator